MTPPGRRRVALVAAGTLAALVVAVVVGLAVGPTPISTTRVIGDLLSRVGIGHSTLSSLDSTIIWQIRAPRMVLGLLAGAMLATAGATYQGVFRNPLADPYLLGVAAGAGLGATIAIVDVGGGSATPSWTPLLAFAGALGAVAVTWVVGGRGARASAATLVLAGVAVASLLTSAQTYLQQSSTNSIARVYIWLLGSLATASWHSVVLVVPYVGACVAVCVAAGRALDVLSVGDEESRSLGLPVRRVRLVVVSASSLGTAAVVSVVGLIGFVGIIVPHIVRLLVGTSYRRILPISVAFGAAFLVLADTIARTIVAPSELPLGVVTAVLGAPVFVAILTLRKTSVR
ncbi:MAG TPA: iron ABC transporter permease [Acidimicrobiales bacterium]|nr:iron ABC transporter permease [Acidimicrobiales bacterium]